VSVNPNNKKKRKGRIQKGSGYGKDRGNVVRCCGRKCTGKEKRIIVTVLGMKTVVWCPAVARDLFSNLGEV